MHLRTSGIFIQSAARDFKRTGAIAPSSRPLAQSMTQQLATHGCRPVHVLEVGGGTGNITSEISRYLSADDRLDVFEIDPRLAGLLRRRVRDEFAATARGARISVHSKAIELISLRPRYDFIISCLPFTNFQPNGVRKIFEIYQAVLKPGGFCSFYEYMFVRRAAGLVSSGPARQRCAGVSRVVREYLDRYCFDRDVVFRNLPPATVYHIRFDGRFARG
jgi:phosphatidylethanolamine/phosphatidyl-N-methylethanolamine N-methyltransferase